MKNADTPVDTTYDKYRQYLRRYSKNIADTIDINTNTAILTTLFKMMPTGFTFHSVHDKNITLYHVGWPYVDCGAVLTTVGPQVPS